MKEIKAVIRPNKLALLHSALRVLPGFPGMTVTKVEGCSALSRVGPVRGIKDELTEFSPKVRVEIVAPDEIEQMITECIIKVGQTGAAGDGLVWVTDLERAVFMYKTGPMPVQT